MMYKKCIRNLLLLSIVFTLLLTGCGQKSDSSSQKGQDTVTILIQEGEELTDEVRVKNQEVLRLRVDTFAKGMEYQFEANGSVIELTIPKELLFYTSPSVIAETFFINEGNWSIGYEDAKLELNKEDFLEIQEGSDVENLPMEYTESTNDYEGNFGSSYNATSCGYIKILFSDRVKAELQTMLEDDGIVYLKDDTGQALLLKGNDGYYYCVYDEQDLLYGNEKIFIHNLTSTPLVEKYKVYEDVPILWEDNEEDFGNNQCLREELSDEAIIVLYGGSTEEPFDIVQQDSATVKARLDGLHIPYAFGKSGTGMYGIAMDDNPLTQGELAGLFSNAHGYLTCGDDSLTTYLSNGYNTVAIEWNEDEQCFYVTTDKENDEILKNWRKTENPIYLSFFEEENLVAVLDPEQSEDNAIYKFIPQYMSDERIGFYQEIILNPSMEGYNYCQFARKNDLINDKSLFEKNEMVEQKNQAVLDSVRTALPSYDVKIEGNIIRIYTEHVYAQDFTEDMLREVKELRTLIEPDIFYQYSIRLYPTTNKNECPWYVGSSEYRNNREEGTRIKYISFVVYKEKSTITKDALEELLSKDSYWDDFDVTVIEK